MQRRHLEQNRLHRPASEPRAAEAECRRDEQQAEREREELAADLLRPGPQRHPQADLTAA